MSLANKRTKDANMAAAMKKAKVERHHCRCPMCHNIVGLNGLYNHLGKCSK
jgi:hypothetical protein